MEGRNGAVAVEQDKRWKDTVAEVFTGEELVLALIADFNEDIEDNLQIIRLQFEEAIGDRKSEARKSREGAFFLIFTG